MALFPSPSAARPAATAPPVVSPPTGPSAQTLPPQAGLRAQARVKLANAVRELVEALGLLKEVGSEEGKAIVSALKTLAPVTPEVDQGLGRSQIMAALAGAQAVQPGGSPPPPTMLGTARPVPQLMGGPPLTGR